LKGRKPKPTLPVPKKAAGVEEIVPPAAAEGDLTLPPVPDWLTPEAKSEWERTGKRLHDAGVTEIDTNALILYCEAWSTWRHALQKVAEYGPVIKTKSQNLVESPYLQIANKAMDQMMRLASGFGLRVEQPAFNVNVNVVLKQQLLALGLPPKIVDSLLAYVGTLPPQS
jgi:P27 family predicted phage terminase small subunit